jgi:hypothetical protein
MVPNEFNRIRSDFKNHDTYFKKQMGNMRDLRKSLNVPLHVVNLQELLDCDKNEYNKLLDFIEQPPLDNWKELITDYRITINY